MQDKFSIYAITFFRDDMAWGSTGTTFGRKPIRAIVGMPCQMLQDIPWYVTEIIFDEQLRSFIISFEEKKVMLVPYKDEIEIIYYNPEDDAGDIQD